MINKLINILILFFLVSCSNNEKKIHEDPSIITVLNTVSINTGKINKNIEINQTDFSDVIGPVALEIDTTPAKMKDFDKNKSIGVILGPGGHRSVAHLSLLKALEDKNIKIHMISGLGMGAVIAAMYSHGLSIDIIEWKFYRFLQEVKSSVAFSSSWLESVENILLEPLSRKNIQEAKQLLVIPVFNNQSSKVEFLRRGSLNESLLLNLNLTYSQNYSTALDQVKLSRTYFGKTPPDITIGVDILGEKVNFEKKNEFLQSLFHRAKTLSDNSIDTIDYKLRLPIEMMAIDTLNVVPEIMRKSYYFILEESDIIDKVKKVY